MVNSFSNDNKFRTDIQHEFHDSIFKFNEKSFLALPIYHGLTKIRDGKNRKNYETEHTKIQTSPDLQYWIRTSTTADRWRGKKYRYARHNTNSKNALYFEPKLLSDVVLEEIRVSDMPLDTKTEALKLCYEFKTLTVQSSTDLLDFTPASYWNEMENDPIVIDFKHQYDVVLVSNNIDTIRISKLLEEDHSMKLSYNMIKNNFEYDTNFLYGKLEFYKDLVKYGEKIEPDFIKIIESYRLRIETRRKEHEEKTKIFIDKFKDWESRANKFIDNHYGDIINEMKIMSSMDKVI